MLRQVKMQEERGVSLLELPWVGASAVIVDLFDDFDEELARSFHASLPQDIVLPFAAWQRLMGDDSDSTADTFELHALLPLECRPGIDVHVTGGLLIFYFSNSNRQAHTSSLSTLFCFTLMPLY